MWPVLIDHSRNKLYCGSEIVIIVLVRFTWCQLIFLPSILVFSFIASAFSRVSGVLKLWLGYNFDLLKSLQYSYLPHDFDVYLFSASLGG